MQDWPTWAKLILIPTIAFLGVLSVAGIHMLFPLVNNTEKEGEE